jgi:acyl dehydratase
MAAPKESDMELTVAQIAAAQDLELGRSAWLTMSHERIVAFADATEDHQWIHTDPERARASRFGTTIAHGFLLLSMLPKLFDEVLRVPEAEMMVNYGLDKVRFLSPVPTGHEICLEAKLASAALQRSGYLMRIQGNLLVRDPSDAEKSRRAVATETLFLVVPKAEAAV